ncbi:putative O-glycosylation ligase, exosortase A system-associated [Alteromonas sp. MTD1]|uniref:putative O-glycosylation ligase, exosortase A system-associated n=1 Tax=Alteromonas sp. MTD1 TaxID=3057962 RepID=UPI0036F3FCD7
MSDFFILAVILTFFVYGLTRPYIAFAGYIWVDTLVPQTIVFGFLHGRPISMIMAGLCFFSLVIGAGKISKPTRGIPVFLLVLFMIWITISTDMAQFQAVAWVKWDTAIKTVLMATLTMFAIKTKKQLESVLLVLVFSLSFFMLTAGIKTLFGGGGYGRVLITGVGNMGMAESSTLAAFSVLVIPFLMFFKKHITLMHFLRGKNWVWNAAILSCVAANIGTTARTGLVTLAGYIGYRSLNKKFFIQGIVVFLFAVLCFQAFAPADWKNRMNTLTEVTDESSAMGRVVVWQWTIDYVKERPFFGGGFQSFLANRGQLINYNENFSFTVKAFHSIYFELLGEQGYGGLIIYLGLIFWAYNQNRKIEKNDRLGEWSRDLGSCMKSAIVIFCIGGAFVGIGYKPIIFQLVALTVVHLKIIDRDSDAEK